jgi:hypothetical protein
MTPAAVSSENRRPLYLRAGLKARVDADGSALRVRAARRADARYPLCRVSRVIAGVSVDWSAAALQACLESGIPIVIAGHDGAPLGSIQPTQSAASRLSDDLEEMLDRPDWRQIYDNWLRAARMTVVQEWRQAREEAGQALAPGEIKEVVRRFVYSAVDATSFGAEAGIWRAALCAMASLKLRHAGMRPVYWGSGGIALDLLDDLTRLLELRLRLEISAGMGQGLTGEAVALRVLHAMSDSLEEQFKRVFASLARRLKQVLSEWR